MNASVEYFLTNAFEYEIRNRIDIERQKLDKIDDLTELEADELQKLESVKKYLQERIGEMRKKAA